MSNSIRTRLTIAFLGLAVGPLLIVGLLLILRTYSVQTEGAVALQREMAAHLSSRVQSLIRNLESGLQMLIRVENLQKLAPERQKLILSIFHSRQSAIDDLILLDACGRVLSYHSRLKPYQDLPMRPQKEFESFTVPMSRGVTYFGPVRSQELSGEPVMIMAVPIITPVTGKPEGVLVADIRLKEIWNLVARIRPGQKGNSFIVDAGKRVVAHSNPSVVLRGTRFDPPGFDGVQMGLNGQESVLVSQVVTFGAQQFHILVEGPVSEALALAIHTVIIMLTIVVIALLAAGSIGFLTVRRIVRPIQDIAETARAINAGDLSRRVVVKSRDELGVLAGAFNKMTSQLGTFINDLEKRVAVRTAELAASNRELEAFAYSVSHDLRAPLRHIDGFLELLRKKAGTALDEQGRHYMEAISDAARKMGLLIDDLLSFSRTGRQAISLKQVDLGSLVRDVIREFEPDAAGRHIEWRISDMPAVNGDAAMLRMVLMNLIANALKFTRPRQEPRIEIGTLPGQDFETVIYVRDNGVGFNPQYADRLFGVFQRLHRSEEFEGTGIGLANVRQIITRHGGRTWAEGKVDQGATFFFSLPQTAKSLSGNSLPLFAKGGSGGI
ncbi:MAG: ATP-binding protein [Thermodesulfobacteriota bacterium]